MAGDVTESDPDATRIEPTGVPSLASASASVDVEHAWSLERGALVGRYFVTDRLGAGGMGEVYSAYDPELDRRVALKLVKFDASEDAAKARGRLLREAQALAKLSHPNVVAVFDAGTHGDRVFIAMEYVEGRTLRDWLRDNEADPAPSSWRTALELMLQAGAGLASAHAQGMVHRDFKPANVMVSDDGRVRVLDFGLARRFDELDSSEEPSPPQGHGSGHDSLDLHESVNSGRGTLSIRLTQTGVVMGTPSTMAPEQFLGRRVDARTDQFSFCVVLYRGLFGIRPFPGQSYTELARAVASGRMRDFPKATRVPRAIQVVLKRGLSASSDARYPTMDALLADLQRALGQGRRRALGLGAAGLLALVLGGGALAGHSATEASPCRGFEDKLEGIWDDDRRRAMATAFSATEVPYAEHARTAVERSLDEYAGTWTRLRTEVCEATQVRGDQSGALMDLRIGCLDDRLHDVAALTTVLTEEVDADVVEAAVLGVGQLPALPECTTLERGQSEVVRPEDPQLAAEVDQARGLIAAARARVLAGKYEDALERGRAALERAEQTGFIPVIAEAHHIVGQSYDRLMEPAPSLAAYEDSLYAAAFSGHVRVEGMALVGMTSVLGMHMSQPEQALRYARHAEAIAPRLGDPPAYLGAISLYRGNTLMGASRLDEALEQFRAAAELTTGMAESEQIHLAALNNIAATLGQKGEYEEAAAAFEHALEASVARVGPWHPMVGSTHNNLGVTYSRLDDTTKAMTHLTRAIEIYEEVLGPDHPELGRGYHNLGVVHSDRGDVEAAHRSYLRALDHKRRTMGPDHVSVAFSANNVGDALVKLGRPDEAIPFIEDALRVWRGARGPDDPNNIYGLVSLAQAELALGRADEAVTHVRQALELADADFDPVERAKAKFVAARAIAAADGDASEALELARASRVDYQAAERPSPSELAAIDRWLADHR